MVISFVCKQCEADDDVELADLLKDPRKLSCSNCRAKLSTDLVEGFASDLDELLVVVNRIHKKFHLEFTVDSEELDPDQPEEEFEEPEDDGLWSDDVEADEDEED
jgi:hypothetical protein